MVLSHSSLQRFEFIQLIKFNQFFICLIYIQYLCFTEWYLIIWLFCAFLFQDDSRRTASNAVTETGPPAMPRLPSCCPQHSPCGGSSQNHHALGHPHAGCFQQHGHHFQHHHHHHHTPHPAVPVSPSFSDPACPVERPPQVQAPCGANSSSATSYHDQVCGIWWGLLFF